MMPDLPLSARLARRTARRIRQSLRFGPAALAHAPILFANSFPKSGTHLLTQVLAGFAQIGPAAVSGLPAVVTYEGDTGRQRATAEILQDLERLLPGDIAYGHLHALLPVVDFLCQEGFCSYFILRDPRDVVVSHVHYVTEMASVHIHHDYYLHKLDTFEERLSTSIAGIQENAEGTQMPDILARFEPYLGWLARPEILLLRYEDFITQLEPTLGRVLDHAHSRGFQPARERSQAIQILAQNIDPQHSPTFRSGKIGGWRQSFTPEHKQLFKQLSGDLLIQLGYEGDHDW